MPTALSTCTADLSSAAIAGTMGDDDVQMTGHAGCEEIQRRKRRRAEADGSVVDLSGARGAQEAGHASLQALVQQFVDASQSGFGVARGIGEHARALARHAWAGTLGECRPAVHGWDAVLRVPLAEVIRVANESGELDAALAAYKSAKLPMLRATPNFRADLFEADLDSVVRQLKGLDFATMRSVDLDNLQAVTKPARRGSRLFTINVFFLELVQLTIKLRETGNAELRKEK